MLIKNIYHRANAIYWNLIVFSKKEEKKINNDKDKSILLRLINNDKADVVWNSIGKIEKEGLNSNKNYI